MERSCERKVVQMKKEWEIVSRGKTYPVVYETGAAAKVTVNGQEEKLQSQSPWLNVIDHKMLVGHETVHLVVIGKKADLAVNGVYLESGEKYEQIPLVPKPINTLVFLNIAGGILLVNILCGLLGLIFGSLYVRATLKGGIVRMYLTFAMCTLVQVIWYGIKNGWFAF